MNKNKVLIIFTEKHFNYSPTLLNLIETLSIEFDINLLIPKQDLKNYKKYIDKVFSYDLKESIGTLILKKIDSLIYRVFKKKFLYSIFLVFFINNYARKIKTLNETKYKEVIGIDYIGYLVGLSFTREVNLISLECYKSDLITKIVELKIKNIKSLAIQNIERKEFFFNKYKGDYFILPNSPNYIENIDKEINKNKLIYLGSFIGKFGKYRLIEFAKNYQNYIIHINGPNQVDDVKLNNIKIESNYVDNNSLNDYLAKFEIGLALYDFLRMTPDERDHFKILSSGKVHNYFNAKLPVIASRCSGLEIVEEFNAGILLDNLDPLSINNAINDIRENYWSYQNGCTNAAKNFDFKLYVTKYNNYLAK